MSTNNQDLALAPEASRQFVPLQVSERTSRADADNHPTIATVERLEVAASKHPDDQNKPGVVIVPSGYGFYFSRAINNGWTDNRDSASSRPLSGFNHPNENEYIKGANRAQLVSWSRPWENPMKFVCYEEKFDWSIGGTWYWTNTGERAWTLRWYMNDDLGRYGDNSGTANIDITIVRL